MKLIVYILILTVSVLAVGAHGQPTAKTIAGTDWQIEPSLKYDTLCFLNVLTGDQFYRKAYEKEYARFASRLTPGVKTALTSLKHRLKDKNGNIISAFLSIYFSATNAETLDEMLDALSKSSPIKAELQKTLYYNKDGWNLFRSVEKDLKVALQFLKDERFDIYWREEILPGIRDKITPTVAYLTGFDLVPEVEKHLGFKFNSGKVVVYTLYFARPHGFRITGTRFITDISYPPRISLRVAIHELLHPPYKLKDDPELRRLLDGLRADRYLMDKVLNHDPSYGYNSFESFIEEDCVRALDQLIGERFGLDAIAAGRWRDEDGGMHVFAAALYGLMKQEKYDGNLENFRAFLLRMLRSGKLSANQIEGLATRARD